MKIPENLGARHGTSELAEIIEWNLDKIKEWFDDCQRGGDYGNFKSEILARISSGDLTDDRLDDEWMHYLTQNASSSNTVPIAHSLVFTVLAENALEKGDNGRGWSFIVHACYLSGFSQSSALQEQIRLTSVKKKEDARKGAAVRAKNDFQPTKNKVIDLLSKMQPQEGWRDVETAARCLLPSIEDYVELHKIKLKKTSLLATIKRWLEQDLDVNSKFEALRAPVATKSQA